MSARRQLPNEASRPRGSWRVAIALFGVAGLGCAPEPDSPADDGLVETTHLRITNTTGNPICAGTSVFLERELERIAAALELPLWPEDEKLDVRFGEEAVAEVCAALLDGDTERLNGCAMHWNGELSVAAVEVSHTSSHELVHAVRRHSLPRGPAMFEEGLAQVLSGSDGFPVYVRYPHGERFVGPLEMLQISREDFSDYYAPAESFVSWLWETHGRSTLMALVNDPAFDGADAALPLFEQHYGLPLADAEQAWRTDERPDPVWGTRCIPERTYSLADGPVELSGELDCNDPLVLGASSWMSLWPMCLEVPENTRVRIAFEADHGELQIFWRTQCDAGAAGAEAYRDKYLDAGDVLEEDIAGCPHQMFIHSAEPGFPSTPYAIRIEEIDG